MLCQAAPAPDTHQMCAANAIVCMCKSKPVWPALRHYALKPLCHSHVCVLHSTLDCTHITLSLLPLGKEGMAGVVVKPIVC
jgi:hypothetical protein